MKHPADMTIGERIMLTLVIVLIIFFALALFGWITGGWDETPAQDAQVSKYDGRLIALDKEAMDEAYKERVRHLFEVWMKDETGQPGRAIVGVRQARRAYIEAMGKIEEREGKQ